MFLTRKEERMLGGEEGPAVAKSMEMLVTLGEIFGAERLVPVESAHISGVSYKNLSDAGLEYLEEQAELGATVRLPASLNPAGMDLGKWREMRVPEAFAEKQLRIIRAFERMGVDPTCTCTPYLIGRVPRLGSQIAWAESSAICYSNSVLGARTNRESGPTTLASAITGLAPLYGYRLDAGRLPGKLVEVKAKLVDSLDYGALGYVTGKELGTTVPYFRSLGRPDAESMKALGAACATSGGTALWHGEGVTPEAESMKPHLNGVEKLTIEGSDVDDAKERFSGEVSDPVYCVGCPHCSLREVKEVAELLEGKGLKGSLCVFTSRGVFAEARRAGLIRRIERAGGNIFVDTCMVVAPLKEMGWRSVATNSFKAAHYSEGMGLAAKVCAVKELVEGAQR
jgi:hypothetical protein